MSAQVYYLLLGTATLSLILVPLLFPLARRVLAGRAMDGHKHQV
jgi:hypothetical protein